MIMKFSLLYTDLSVQHSQLTALTVLSAHIGVCSVELIFTGAVAG